MLAAGAFNKSAKVAEGCNHMSVHLRMASHCKHHHPNLCCRRTLDSADFQLLVHFDEPCTCGSQVRRASCCFSTSESGEGGVLWPQFHCCQCDNAADAFTNPNVGCHTFVCHSAVGHMVVTVCACLHLCSVAALSEAVLAS